MERYKISKHCFSFLLENVLQSLHGFFLNVESRSVTSHCGTEKKGKKKLRDVPRLFSVRSRDGESASRDTIEEPQGPQKVKRKVEIAS